MSAPTDTLVSFSGEEFVTTARASAEVGFTQDYVAQLAREGRVAARQVNGAWYVDLAAVKAYKKGQELSSAQVETMGVPVPIHLLQKKEDAATVASDDDGLFPVISKQKREAQLSPLTMHDVSPTAQVPIRRYAYASDMRPAVSVRTRSEEEREGSRLPIVFSALPFPMVITAALTIVVVLSLGIATLKSHSVYATKAEPQSLTASAALSLTGMGDILEEVFVPELTYKRAP